MNAATVKQMPSAEAAAVDIEQAQQIDCVEINHHPDRLARLFMVNPMPARLALMIGARADEGLLYVAAATALYDGFDDGTYSFADPQLSGGFCFSCVVLVSLRNRGTDE